MLKTPQGQIHLDPAEMTLLAIACDCLSKELEDSPDVATMLHVEAMGLMFQAQALANAYEFYLDKEQKAKARAWANTLTKGLPE
ncbi:MAG: hypothetical protein WC657_08580 [Candidatus Paceibacterota bacterium]|jgi:hypothetical protein